MLIYGSSPDALAAQQNWYDNYYQNASERNAAAISGAQASSVDLQARKDAQDKVDAQNQNQFQSNQDFSGREDAANRAQNLIISGAKSDTKTYDELVKTLPYLPSDPTALARFAPGLTTVQFSQLQALIAKRDHDDSADKLARWKAAGDPNLPIPSGLIPADVAEATTFQQNYLRKPTVDNFANATKTAADANFIVKARADQAAVAANPVPDWTGGVSKDSIIVPNPAAVSRLNDYQLPDTTDPKISLVVKSAVPNARNPYSVNPITAPAPPASWTPIVPNTPAPSQTPVSPHDGTPMQPASKPPAPATKTPTYDPNSYQSAMDVKAAFKAGLIDRLTAKKILHDQFGQQ